MPLLLALAACMPKSGPLTVLHTNDQHARYLPSAAPWLPGSPEIGGWEALDAEVDAVRLAVGAQRVLLLDAGDLLTGTPLSEIEVDGARGGAMIAMIEEVGYDAWTLGNHEFDQGLDNVAALVRASDVPVLGANLLAEDGDGPGVPGVRPHVVLGRGGIRVGIVGIVTEDLERYVGPDVRAAVRVRPAVETVRDEVAALDRGTDLLVVLSHAGEEVDRLVAAVPGVDLVVGGHSHTALTTPERVGEAWVVQAGSGVRSLGREDVVVEGDRIARMEGRLVDLVPGRGPASPEIVRATGEYRARIDAAFGEVVGRATAPLPREAGSGSPLGDWVADVLRESTGADVAVVNAGGLRADLPAGDLTRRHVYEVLPFDNEVMTFVASGAALQGILRRNAAVLGGAGGSPTHLSGVAWTWRSGPGGGELVAATVGGVPLDRARTYRVAASDFVADHWADKYGGEAPGDPQASGRTMLGAVLEALSRAPAAPPAPRATEAPAAP